MRYIALTRGYRAIVDDSDFAELSKWKWSALICGNRIYARRGEEREGIYRGILMHRQILNVPRDFETDHINHNGLDNRRSNLRIANKSQNQANRRVNKNSPSGYKGVQFEKKKGKFRVQIQVNKVRRFLGYFDSAEEAAQIYTKAANDGFGTFANSIK